jgi:hypothetical protein
LEPDQTYEYAGMNGGFKEMICPICDCHNLIPVSFKGLIFSCGGCAQLLNLPETEVDFYNEIQDFRIKLRDHGMIMILWSIEDVYSCADDCGMDKPTKEEALEVIRLLEKHHDASCGISWETIQYTLSEVLCEHS